MKPLKVPPHGFKWQRLEDGTWELRSTTKATILVEQEGLCRHMEEEEEDEMREEKEEQGDRVFPSEVGAAVLIPTDDTSVVKEMENEGSSTNVQQ